MFQLVKILYVLLKHYSLPAVYFLVVYMMASMTNDKKKK